MLYPYLFAALVDSILLTHAVLEDLLLSRCVVIEVTFIAVNALTESGQEKLRDFIRR